MILQQTSQVLCPENNNLKIFCSTSLFIYSRVYIVIVDNLILQQTTYVLSMENYRLTVLCSTPLFLLYSRLPSLEALRLPSSCIALCQRNGVGLCTTYYSLKVLCSTSFLYTPEHFLLKPWDYHHFACQGAREMEYVCTPLLRHLARFQERLTLKVLEELSMS